MRKLRFAALNSLLMCKLFKTKNSFWFFFYLSLTAWSLHASTEQITVHFEPVQGGRNFSKFSLEFYDGTTASDVMNYFHQNWKKVDEKLKNPRYGNERIIFFENKEGKAHYGDITKHMCLSGGDTLYIGFKIGVRLIRYEQFRGRWVRKIKKLIFGEKKNQLMEQIYNWENSNKKKNEILVLESSQNYLYKKFNSLSSDLTDILVAYESDFTYLNTNGTASKTFIFFRKSMAEFTEQLAWGTGLFEEGLTRGSNELLYMFARPIENLQEGQNIYFRTKGEEEKSFQIDFEKNLQSEIRVKGKLMMPSPGYWKLTRGEYFIILDKKERLGACSIIKIKDSIIENKPKQPLNDLMLIAQLGKRYVALDALTLEKYKNLNPYDFEFSLLDKEGAKGNNLKFKSIDDLPLSYFNFFYEDTYYLVGVPYFDIKESNLEDVQQKIKDQLVEEEVINKDVIFSYGGEGYIQDKKALVSLLKNDPEMPCIQLKVVGKAMYFSKYHQKQQKKITIHYKEDGKPALKTLNLDWNKSLTGIADSELPNIKEASLYQKDKEGKITRIEHDKKLNEKITELHYAPLYEFNIEDEHEKKTVITDEGDQKLIDYANAHKDGKEKKLFMKYLDEKNDEYYIRVEKERVGNTITPIGCQRYYPNLVMLKLNLNVQGTCVDENGHQEDVIFKDYDIHKRTLYNEIVAILTNYSPRKHVSSLKINGKSIPVPYASAKMDKTIEQLMQDYEIKDNKEEITIRMQGSYNFLRLTYEEKIGIASALGVVTLGLCSFVGFKEHKKRKGKAKKTKEKKKQTLSKKRPLPKRKLDKGKSIKSQGE